MSSISGVGTLHISASDDCKVLIDDELLASLHSGEERTVNLLPGIYSISAKQKQGLEWGQTVKVESGSETRVTIDFGDASEPESHSSGLRRTIIQPSRGPSSSKSKYRKWGLILTFFVLITGAFIYFTFPDWNRSVPDISRLSQVVVSTFGTDAIVTKEDTPVDITLIEEARPAYTVSLTQQPDHGSLELSGDSTEVTFVPEPDFAGTDHFRYLLRKSSETDTLEITVEVTPVPDAPRPVQDRYVTSYNTSATLSVLSNDRHPDGLFFQITDVDLASSGDLKLIQDSTEIVYSPNDGFHGVDRFQYTIADERGNTDEASVSVDVQDRPPVPGDVDVNWVRISSGSFVMGTKTGSSDARPSHRVSITKPFRISAHEVTVEQFRTFVEATGYQTQAERVGGAWRAGDSLKTPGLTWRNPGFPQADDHPVVCVSWEDARAFAAWMDARLPTEAEWEYAARSGVTQSKLPGDWKETTWYAKNADGGTRPVSQKAPNEWGLYDVQGNVWEWVQDWYSSDYYEKSPTADPQGPNAGALRVCRGGSWYDKACWLPIRNRASPTYRANNIGFRIVKPVPANQPS